MDVVVVAAASAGAAVVVLVEDGDDDVVEEESAAEEDADVDVVVRFTLVEVVVSSRMLEALPPSMTPVSRKPMKRPTPMMARSARAAANLLILVLLSNSALGNTPFVHFCASR
ncbi:MAG: hypothetical protein ACRDZ3_16825 [Acidimicrobiia bacterium]